MPFLQFLLECVGLNVRRLTITNERRGWSLWGTEGEERKVAYEERYQEEISAMQCVGTARGPEHPAMDEARLHE